MKKSIATLVLALPLAIFAQNNNLEGLQRDHNDPFAAINNGHKVSQEYIDIAQTAAVINLQNTVRGAGDTTRGLINIKRELINLNNLTDGLKPNSTEEINDFLKR